MSHSRSNQLRELQSIIEEISHAIMWVNEREEEELVFDWGDKNIDRYIPKKQESYSVRLNCWMFPSQFMDVILPLILDLLSFLLPLKPELCTVFWLSNPIFTWL